MVIFQSKKETHQKSRHLPEQHLRLNLKTVYNPFNNHLNVCEQVSNTKVHHSLKTVQSTRNIKTERRAEESAQKTTNSCISAAEKARQQLVPREADVTFGFGRPCFSKLMWGRG